MTTSDDAPITAPPADATARPWFRSKWFNLALGLIVTFASLGYALYVMADGQPLSVVLRQIGDAFAEANYITLLPMWGLLFAFYWLKAWRWRMLLAPLGNFRTSRLFPPTLIGFAFNNVLPAHLGEFVRVYVFSRQSGQSKTAVLTTLVVERVFDAIAILVLLGVGLAFLPPVAVTPDSDAAAGGGVTAIQEKAVYVAGAAALAVLAAAAYLTWPGRFVRIFEAVLARIPLLPEGWRVEICRLIETGASGLASLKSGPLLIGIVVTSFLQWALNGLQIHLALWSFDIHVSPLVSCVVLGVVAVGVTVPSSPGYFGVIQFCFLMVLMLFVPDRKPAIMAASIYYHMVQWIPVTLLGMLYFVRSGLHVADIEHEAEEGGEVEG